VRVLPGVPEHSEVVARVGPDGAGVGPRRLVAVDVSPAERSGLDKAAVLVQGLPASGRRSHVLGIVPVRASE